MTNEEINTAISAWFEPKPAMRRQAHHSVVQEITESPKGFWLPNWRTSGPADLVPCTQWQPLDYLHSEDANARLVDRLLSEGKHLMYVQQLKGGVLLWVDSTHSHLGKDRREANVLAFCASAGIAHKRDGGEK